MRDRRDYVIAALAGALLFSLGLLIGIHGVPGLPAAQAQEGADTIDPAQPPTSAPGAGQPPGGIQINQGPNLRPGTEGRTVAPTASDSDSNNRFVAVTCPVGSGESVLFLIDSENEQIAVYGFERRKGLTFLSGRKIDFDLKITGYKDRSEFTRDEMRRLFEREIARAAAEAAKDKSGG